MDWQLQDQVALARSNGKNVFGWLIDLAFEKD